MLQPNIRLSGATVLVTGAAGFIGASLTERLLDEYPDCRVIGIDNITDYYDVRLKHGRLERLRAYGRLTAYSGNSGPRWWSISPHRRG